MEYTVLIVSKGSEEPCSKIRQSFNIKALTELDITFLSVMIKSRAFPLETVGCLLQFSIHPAGGSGPDDRARERNHEHLAERRKKSGRH